MSVSVPARPDSSVPAPPGERPLRPIERVAVILALLEPDQARSLADRLEPNAIERVIDAYERMRTVPKATLLKTIASFVVDVRAKGPRVRGGTKEAAALASAILPEAEQPDFEPIEMNMASGSLAPGADAEAVWNYLKSMQPAEIARLVANERPSVIAAVIANLPDPHGAGIITSLPEEKAAAVVAQMAQGSPVNAATLDAITESLRVQVSESDGDETAGDENEALPRLTAILNRCPLSRQKAVLDPLRAIAAEHAEAVENGLIRFEKLGQILPRNAAPILFREVDESLLNTAIRYSMETAPDAVEYLYSNISQRLAEQIRERIAAQKLPDQEEGEAAQAEMLAQLLEWSEDGRFTINFDGNPEE